MVELALKRKEQIPGERSFIIRINNAIERSEIQFVDAFSSEHKWPITLSISDFAGFEDRGKAVFLVFQEMWIGETSVKKGEKRTERLDYLYRHMKAALKDIDALREEGVHVLTKEEYEGIMQQQRLSEEN